MVTKNFIMTTTPKHIEMSDPILALWQKKMVVAAIGENVSHTGQNSLLPMRLFIPNPSSTISSRSLITCHAALIHTFHLAAPMVVLTNSLIGTEHRSWG